MKTPSGADSTMIPPPSERSVERLPGLQWDDEDATGNSWLGSQVTMYERVTRETVRPLASTKSREE